MRKVKKIARFIIELILTIAIISFILINLISSTILSKSYILSSLEKTDYFSKISKQLEENFENYIQQSGLDEDVLKNVVTKEKIEKDSKKIITNIYDDFYEEISTQELTQNLQKNIQESIGNRTLTSAEQKAIDEFINQIVKEYKSTISNLEYEKQINSGYKKIMKYVSPAKKVAVVVIGICAVILILLNLKRTYKIGTNFGISFLASGAILTIIDIYIKTKLDIRYITILNDAISDVIRHIAESVIGTISKDGIVLIICGLILIFVSNFIHSITKYKNIIKKDNEEE